MIYANNAIMRTIEILRRMSRMSKTEMAKHLSSRTRYYEHMEAQDVKFSAIKNYLDILGYDLIARNRESGFEKKL